MMKHFLRVLLRPVFIFLFSSFACLSFAENRDSGALTFSDEAPKQAPSKELYDQYVEYGNYYLKEGLYQEAKDELWKAAELFPDNPDAYINIAIVHIRQQEYDNALRMLDKAQQLAPANYYQSEILFYNFGLAYFYSGNYKEAIDYFNKALGVYPDFGEALLYLGLADDKTGDTGGAFISIFEARYLFEKNKLSDMQAQAAGLLKELSQRPALDTVLLAQRFYEQGKAALDKNDLEKASYLFKESIFLNPQYTDVYYQLALLYSRQNAPHNAIAYLMRIIEVDPANVNAHMSLGYAYRDLKKYDQALQYLQKAAELEPNNATIVYDIATTYSQIQRDNDARKYFMQSRKLALADKNLFLIEKIDAGLKQIALRQSLPAGRTERPLPVPKTVPPRDSKKDLHPNYAIGGNQGSFSQGNFIPPKETLETQETQHQHRALMSSEQHRY